MLVAVSMQQCQWLFVSWRRRLLIQRASSLCITRLQAAVGPRTMYCVWHNSSSDSSARGERAMLHLVILAVRVSLSLLQSNARGCCECSVKYILERSDAFRI